MYARYRECEAEVEEAREMVKDAAGDLEMESMAREEIAGLTAELGREVIENQNKHSTDVESTNRV